MSMAARRSRDGCRERRLTHRLPFPDRRTTEGGKTHPATSVHTRARRPHPSPPHSRRATRARRRGAARDGAGREREGEDVRREGGRRLVRRRPGRRGVPDALLPRRDPIAPGRREGLLERRGGHSAGARLRAAAQGGPRPEGWPRADRHGLRAYRRAADRPRWTTRDDPTVPTDTTDPESDTLATPGVDTSGPSSVPIPLLILGGLALLLLAAGAAGYLSRRAQARRNGGPPGPA